MKTAESTTLNTITYDYVNQLSLIVHAEWSHNRFYRAIAENTPTEDSSGYDIEMFPISSIVKPDRPTSGINKAIVGQAFAEPESHDSVPAGRYYLASPEDLYKYWRSPQSSGVGPGFVMANCAPQVTYVEENDVSGSPVPRTVVSNKINFTVENTYAWPVDYDVQIKTTTGGVWTTIASDLAIPSNGKVSLWYNGTSWTTTKTLGSSTTIYGVRLVVNAMDKESYFNLIELSAALELDLTSDVVSMQDNFTMGEPDFITPLGNISTNTASVALFNDAKKYSNDEPTSPLVGLIDKGVKLVGWYRYGSDDVQAFKMYSDEWSESDDQVDVQLVDQSRILQSVKPPVVLYQNLSVQEIVWRICDAVGFTDYVVETGPTDPHTIIDIFWTDGEKTAWELFGELARATQTAIYFDSYGMLNIKTREAAWDESKASTFDFIRDTVPGGQPANIVTLSSTDQYESNKVTVNWKPTNFSERVGNVYPFEVVWEPEGDVVLRASELVKNMTNVDNEILLSRRDAETWPWAGMCQIEGEWISYSGKEYIHYSADGTTRNTTWVESFEQQKRLDEISHIDSRYRNQYTGKLRVTQRGLWNTEAKAHTIDLGNWTKSRKKNYGAAVSPCSGIFQYKPKTTEPSPSLNTTPSDNPALLAYGSQSASSSEYWTYSIGTAGGARKPVEPSVLIIEGGSTLDSDDYTYLHRGNGTDLGYEAIGVRMRIDKSTHKEKNGGFFFYGDNGLGTGYFIDVMATARMDGAMRKKRNEVVLYSMKSDGTKKRFGGQELKIKDKSKNHKRGATIKVDVGARLAVPQSKWIDIDVTIKTLGNNDHYIMVYAYGKLLFDATIPVGEWRHDKRSLFGLFARGNSKVSFDYVYAFTNLPVEPLDGEGYYDRIEGGYIGNQAMLEWTYSIGSARRMIKKKWTTIQVKKNQRIFEEFGPIVHEVRQFDVKFTSETPSLQSKIYFSNKRGAVCTEYWSDPKTAHFVMANISRDNAVINGEDNLVSENNGSVNQRFFVYGRPVKRKDEQKIVKDDEWAQRRRGVIEVEYASDWIQNREAAERLGDWLTTQWSRTDMTIEMEVFGNPLIELTDVVHVEHEEIDHDFYVVGVSNSFDAGLTTNLTLRRLPTQP